MALRCAPDAFEADSMLTAAPIAVGGTLTRAICQDPSTGADIDWFAFDAPGGVAYTAGVVSGGSALNVGTLDGLDVAGGLPGRPGRDHHDHRLAERRRRRAVHDPGAGGRVSGGAPSISVPRAWVPAGATRASFPIDVGRVARDARITITAFTSVGDARTVTTTVRGG